MGSTSNCIPELVKWLQQVKSKKYGEKRGARVMTMHSICMGTREMQKLPRVNSVELCAPLHVPSVVLAKPMPTLPMIPMWRRYSEGVVVNSSTHKAIHEPWEE